MFVSSKPSTQAGQVSGVFALCLCPVNLPPTLAKSQVSSVRKNLKMQMLALLRHSASSDFIPQITTLLTDLGATQSEVRADSRPRRTGTELQMQESGIEPGSVIW